MNELGMFRACEKFDRKKSYTRSERCCNLLWMRKNVMLLLKFSSFSVTKAKTHANKQPPFLLSNILSVAIRNLRNHIVIISTVDSCLVERENTVAISFRGKQWKNAHYPETLCKNRFALRMKSFFWLMGYAICLLAFEYEFLRAKKVNFFFRWFECVVFLANHWQKGEAFCPFKKMHHCGNRGWTNFSQKIKLS